MRTCRALPFASRSRATKRRDDDVAPRPDYARCSSAAGVSRSPPQTVASTRDCDSAASHSSTRSTRQARRFIWLVLARVLHEQGDLDAVVDVELVEQAGDVGLDRWDGEVQGGRDLRIRVAAADGEGDIVLAWAERSHEV